MINFFSRKQKEPSAKQDPVLNEATIQASAVDSWDVMRGVFDMSNVSAGQVVNEQTAMRVSAVYSCVRLISGAVASLPLHCYERDGNGDRIRTDHATLRLLNEQPDMAWPAPAWWEFVLIQMMMRGDSFAYLRRNRAAEVIGIMPLKRSQVSVEELKPANPRDAKRLRYNVTTDSGTFGCDEADMLHFPGMGFDGVSSMSVIEYGARSSIGIAIGADDHAGKFFSQGTKIDHVIKAQGKMSETQQEAFLAAWKRKYSGGAANGLPLILTEGLDIDELTMTAKDAQLLESRQWQVVDIARAFGVPNHMINQTTGATSWGSGIEQMGIGFVTYTLQPHLNRIESELNRKIYRRASDGIRRYFVEFSPAGLLRGDNQGRANYYKAGLGGTQNPAWMTPNEVRRLENLPPLPGGDQLYAPEHSDDEPNEPDEPDAGQRREAALLVDQV